MCVTSEVFLDDTISIQSNFGICQVYPVYSDIFYFCHFLAGAEKYPLEPSSSLELLSIFLSSAEVASPAGKWFKQTQECGIIWSLLNCSLLIYKLFSTTFSNRVFPHTIQRLAVITHYSIVFQLLFLRLWNDSITCNSCE